MQCRALIAGGGPSGLAAALLLDQLGWTDIVLVEQRAKESGFDRGRAFNYQLEGRGQRLLERIGIDAAQMARFGLPNDHFTLTRFPPVGEPKILQPPILIPNRKTPFWMTRTRLLQMLHTRLEQTGASQRIRLLDGHAFEGFVAKGELYEARIKPQHGSPEFNLSPELILACDGLGSRVRSSLAEASPAIGQRMRRIVHDSPSAGLAYKVLNLPASFAVCEGRHTIADHTMAYAFLSGYRDPKRRMALFALPVATAEDPRSVNIILSSTHDFWSLNNAIDIREFLQKGFPQFDVPAIAGDEEFAAFAAAPAGKFPKPQYIRHIVQSMPAATDESTTTCVLIGDAAHAFPPDLGMGVNSALEDLAELEPYLGMTGLDENMKEYAAHREPDQAALVRLVQRVHPYQYNQSPWRLKLWTIRFLIHLLLHRVSGRLIAMPGFMLSQCHQMSFRDMERRYRSGNRTLSALAIAAIVIVCWLVLR